MHTYHSKMTKSADNISRVLCRFEVSYLLESSSFCNLEDVFRFELCSYTQALFSGMQFLREANKPVLANAIWSDQLPMDPQ